MAYSYRYHAITAQGRIIRGWQHADSRLALQQQLADNGLVLLKAQSLPGWLYRPSTLPSSELILLFNNLQQLSQAGIPLMESLHDIGQCATHPACRALLNRIRSQLENGQSLSQAMATYPQVFSALLISLVRIGEQTGQLTTMFRYIAHTLQWQHQLRQQTLSLLLYPAFVCLVISAASLFLLCYLVPQLQQILSAMGAAIPLHTQLLFQLSAILSEYGWWLAGLLIGLLSATWLGYRYHAGLRQCLHRLLLRCKPIGPLLQQIMLARFTHAFALMYKSGIAIPDCLQQSRLLISDPLLQRALLQIQHQVANGHNLASSFAGCRLFPLLMVRMIQIGESSGTLDQTLQQSSDYYQQQIEQQVKRLQAMTEPLMTLLLGIILGWIMLSVLGPLYDMIGTIPL